MMIVIFFDSGFWLFLAQEAPPIKDIVRVTYFEKTKRCAWLKKNYSNFVHLSKTTVHTQ